MHDDHPGAREYLLRNEVRSTERDHQEIEFELQRVRKHVARTQPILRKMHELLARTQDSKFWQLRNAWFGLRKKLRLGTIAPEPYYLPDVHDLDGVTMLERPYERWKYGNRIRPSDRRLMREMLAVLPLRPRFSVIMPVFDPPEPLLREAIDSVLAQLYPDWELCVADDASTNPAIRATLEELAALDPRIKLTFRATNGHISAASNSALALATGEFVALLDHDDVLAPDALFEVALAINKRPDADVIYSDEDKIDEHGRRRDPYFKPDWSPESLLSRNYVSHLGVYRRTLVEAVGGFREGFEGSQDYDLLLRISERTDKIEHVPRVLYHWRAHTGSAGAARGEKGYSDDAAVRALEEALARRGEPGRVVRSETPGIYTVRYAITRPGRVSVIVPTRDHGEDVERCLRSLFERTTYPNFEVVLIDNGSRDPDSLRVFADWAAREPERLKLVPFDVPFNFSRINNLGVARASGTYVLFLNNDTEVLTDDWLEAMVEYAQRPPIGAVGAKLLYPDGTVQHGGVIVGLGGVAGHSNKYAEADAPGYMYTLQTVNNFSAVTGACMMLRREVFEQAGGFDEAFAVSFNDVDLCLRIRAAGYRNVYLPHVVLRHYESKSRGIDDTPEKQARALAEQELMRRRWRTHEVPDPYYNVNLTLDAEDYAIGL